MKPLAPNTLLQNRYLIVHLIGKGGMGEVYLAVDQRLGSAIALKRTLHADDEQLGGAFEREARTLARLRHPALPKVSDHFIENDNQYLIMDHISGDDLAKRLTATGKPFPLSWVLFWADQLLDALAYLHTHEPPIIHRDIKPQNLKLTDENNIVLLDFGLSKNSAAGQSNLGNTSGSGSTGSVVGYTPHYAPMEQIRGTGTSPRSDIYSLSATLYQLLTNFVPPDALSRADFLLSGKADPITPINEINSEIPKAISDVILKGMSISQDHRFADAREMQKVLRETYAKMQSNTSEKTIAFNMADEPSAPVAQSSPFSPDDKTEKFSAPVFNDQPVSKEAMGAQTIPFGMVGNSNSSAESSAAAVNNAEKTEQIQDFDSTIRIESEPQNVSVAQNFGQKTEVLPVPADSAAPPPAQQSGIKTEVFGGDFGAADYLQNNQTAQMQNPVTESFETKTNESPVPNFTGDQTVPFIGIDSQRPVVDLAQTQPISAFDSVPPVENSSSTAETRLPTQDFVPDKGQGFPPVAPNYAPTPNQPPPPNVQPRPAKKKGKGLIFAVLGALFGLVILAAAGGGIAWYLMNQPSVSGTTNVATPSPEPSPSPTPEPTAEQANTNTGNISNSDVVSSNSVDNSAVNTDPVPDKTRTTTTQTPVTVPTIKPTTPRPTQSTVTPRPATPRPTSKPETKPTLRGTVIPQ